MKRISLFLLFALLAPLALFADMNLEATAHPTRVVLTWDEVDGAAWYDIYEDSNFVERLSAGASEYDVKHLRSNTNYSFSVAARTEDNKDLDAGFADATTTSWDGTYTWTNDTNKNNKGRMESLTLRIETAYNPKVGQYYNVYLEGHGPELQIFPLYPIGDPESGEWVDYKSTSMAGTSYRTNAELFNTSIFKPGKWRVEKIIFEEDGAIAIIETSAIGIKVMTETSYDLVEGEDGMNYLVLDTTSENSMVNSILFKNPNPGAKGGAFILWEDK